MKYKTELHCHTSEVSPCASEDAAATVEKYIAAGYTTVVLTNHYSRHSRWVANMKGVDFNEFFFEGFRKFKECAGDRLNVIFSAEVTLDDPYDKNDYLIYGITEDFFRENPDILDTRIWHLRTLCDEHNALLIHAHPVNKGYTLRDTKQVHGYEVINGGDRHNDLALMWANYYGGIKTAGSDHHTPEDYPTCGIETDEPILTGEQLVCVLKSGRYTVFGSEKPDNSRAKVSWSEKYENRG